MSSSSLCATPDVSTSERSISEFIVASDVEGTLTTGETWRALGRYYQQSEQSGAYRRFFAARTPGFALMKLGVKDEAKYKNRWIEDLAQFFKGMDKGELALVAAWVVENELWLKRRLDVVAELARHREDGHTLVLASGVYQPILEVLAERLGAVALGTPLEIDGVATGQLSAEVNTGEAKLARLTAWLAGRPLRLAYGDTEADVPMLTHAKSAVAVYPDTALEAAAHKRGWRILGTPA